MFETSLLFEKLPEEENTKWWSWGKSKLLGVVVLVALGVACMAWGTWLLYKPLETQVSDIPLLNLDETSSIYVDVGGAVAHPGIYPLQEGERMATALEAAGGLTSDADRNYVNASLNLSAKLKDEQKIYVPFMGERIETDSLTNQTASITTRNDNLVSINSAAETELDELPKIGPATAQKIIDGRPYTTIDELVSKKIIGEAVFAEIKASIKI